ncbi:MAG: hypothetical protein ACREJC_15140, partial [Tepidisphaeraceae bacterium]
MNSTTNTVLAPGISLVRSLRFSGRATIAFCLFASVLCGLLALSLRSQAASLRRDAQVAARQRAGLRSLILARGVLLGGPNVEESTRQLHGTNAWTEFQRRSASDVAVAASPSAVTLRFMGDVAATSGLGSEVAPGTGLLVDAMIVRLAAMIELLNAGPVNAHDSGRLLSLSQALSKDLS